MIMHFAIVYLRDLRCLSQTIQISATFARHMNRHFTPILSSPEATMSTKEWLTISLVLPTISLALPTLSVAHPTLSPAHPIISMAPTTISVATLTISMGPPTLSIAPPTNRLSSLCPAHRKA